MPGIPHEVVLIAIREKPELFAEVFRRIAGINIPGPIDELPCRCGNLKCVRSWQC